MSPYVGMAQKQDGGSNGCISNYMMITQLGASVTHFEALFYPFQVLHLLTRPPKSPVSNANIAATSQNAILFFFFLSSARLVL